MEKDATNTLAALMEIGATGILPRQIVENRKMIEESGVNRESPEFWYACCAALVNEEPKNLFRGLVIAERELELSGGSVSGAIWVLRYLGKILTPSELFDLVDWAIEHRGKWADYTPLGVAIQKDVWKQVERNALQTDQGNYLDRLRSRAVEIRKGGGRNGSGPAFTV